MHQRTLVEGIRKGHHHRNQQHHHARPLEKQCAQVFQSVIGAKHIEENLMNNLEAENGVDRLAQPETPEIQTVVAGAPKRKDDCKIRNLYQEEQEKYRKLLVQLTAP